MVYLLGICIILCGLGIIEININGNCEPTIWRGFLGYVIFIFGVGIIASAIA